MVLAVAKTVPSAEVAVIPAVARTVLYLEVAPVVAVAGHVVPPLPVLYAVLVTVVALDVALVGDVLVEVGR